MPKRRVRTAAQIAASKRNLEKARKARALQEGRIPVGKNVLLIHRTTPEAADLIVAQQRMRGRYKGSDKTKARAFFTPASSRSGAKFYGGFGTAAVSVRVPRKLMQRDNFTEYRYYGAVTVSLKDLQGRKIRRHY